MPCASEYMEPTLREVELSRIMSCLDELEGRTFDHKKAWQGYHHEVYCKDTSQERLDANTRILCGALKRTPKEEIRELSLELQIWWRDHQASENHESD